MLAENGTRCAISFAVGSPEHALLLLPTTVGPAPLRGLTPEQYRSFTFPSFSLLAIAVLGGLPQLTLPVARIDGLPIGLSIVASAGSDELLLEIAAAMG